MQIPGVIRSASLRPIIPKTTSVGLMNKKSCEHDEELLINEVAFFN